ncbi:MULTISPECIES: hypothetical protein [unclassified Sutcliffiella]|uniref:hypothetical protein n=1 Tax=unclassified Sutcliffiella TaxID=2837532 RepID=UPI0030D1ECBB
MIILIRSTNVQWTDEGEVGSVQVGFSGHTAERNVNINGTIPLSAEEYSGNESISALTGLVKQHLRDQMEAEQILATPQDA